ncbi:FkbM family methyltransferase [Desulfosarcina sp. OttesenSCG-928-B08]|nr:FkbM family methyltransferase [Desulfosarcina sp. OttesenSCG-928-B08]
MKKKKTARRPKPQPAPQHKARLYPVESVQYLLLDSPDFISIRLRRGEVWEKFTLQIAELLLHNVANPVVIDIGANLGAFSVPIGQLIKPFSGRLYAFEPQRQVFYQLCGNLFANLLSNCYAYNIAIGNEDTEVEIPVLDMAAEQNVGAMSLDENIRKQQNWHNSKFSEYEAVLVRTLDTLGLPAPDLIKIDVEGLELEVLEGGRNWLAASGYPPVLYEVWGDYMAGMIEKREKLTHFVQHELGYEIQLIGELCIAQHPTRKKLTYQQGQDNNVMVSLISP